MRVLIARALVMVMMVTLFVDVILYIFVSCRIFVRNYVSCSGTKDQIITTS